MVAPVFSLYARDRGADEALVGLLGAVPSVVSVLCAIPGGAIAGSFGKSAVFTWAFIAGVLAAAGYVVAPGASWLIPVQALFGLNSSLFWPSQGAYVTEVIPERHRARILGLVMSITGAAAVLGPAVAGVLADRLGYSAMFVVYGVIGCVSMALCRRIRDGADGVSLVDVRRAVRSSVSAAKQILDRRTLRFTSLATILTFAFAAILDGFLPLYLGDMGYSVAFAGGIITIRMAFFMGGRLASGRLMAALKMESLLLIILFAGIAAVGLVPVLDGRPYMALANAFAGVSLGIAPVITTVIIASATDDEERPVAMAVDSTACGMGRILSSLLFGQVAKIWGSGTSLLLGCSLLSGCTLALAAWFERGSDG